MYFQDRLFLLIYEKGRSKSWRIWKTKKKKIHALIMRQNLAPMLSFEKYEINKKNNLSVFITYFYGKTLIVLQNKSQIEIKRIFIY